MRCRNIRTRQRSASHRCESHERVLKRASLSVGLRVLKRASLSLV